MSHVTNAVPSWSSYFTNLCANNATLSISMLEGGKWLKYFYFVCHEWIWRLICLPVMIITRFSFIIYRPGSSRWINEDVEVGYVYRCQVERLCCHHHQSNSTHLKIWRQITCQNCKSMEFNVKLMPNATIQLVKYECCKYLKSA